MAPRQPLNDEQRRLLKITVRMPLEVWPESHWPRFLLIQRDGLQSYTAL